MCSQLGARHTPKIRKPLGHQLQRRDRLRLAEAFRRSEPLLPFGPRRIATIVSTVGKTIEVSMRSPLSSLTIAGRRGGHSGLQNDQGQGQRVRQDWSP